MGAPYAALLNASNPGSGTYGGMSWVLFPAVEGPALISLVVGTHGLSPDEQILGRPGHARRARAIASWLNRRHGRQIAWAKHEPTRLDVRVPDSIRGGLEQYSNALQKYGDVIYLLVDPTGLEREELRTISEVTLDFFFKERGIQPLTAARKRSDAFEAEYLAELMPTVTKEEVTGHLQANRFVILQGPPGTGKTRMAGELLREHYGGNGTSIQFHPSQTYESFVGGLAPTTTSTDLGMRFEPQKGALMRAAEAALNTGQDYLLHIDEINRADLATVLGEAIYLLEPSEPERSIELAHEFGEPFGSRLFLPPNLHILGTMNSADRSIAILDIAVRRRFAFLKLWPQQAVVEEHGTPETVDAFARLFNIFVDHASEDAFELLPGHSYFLGDEARNAQLQTKLVPLLDEYLQQGYVSGFSEDIRGYLQWVSARQ